jgi:23S rRNA (uridine2552-2'-O)-methyltransferase
VAVARVKPDGAGGGRVVAIDLSAMEAVPGATVLQLDARAPETIDTIKAALGGAADVVLSDMAPAATGHAQTDHLRIMALAETAYECAADLLAPGGSFVAKVLQGGAERQLLSALKRDFASVRHVKPAASRSDSSEVYIVALGFRGRGSEPG